MATKKRMHLIDTTLRDGEQSPDIVLSVQNKIEVAKLLDDAGVYQIEVGIPGMGGEEKAAIKTIAAERKQARIAVWNRMNVEDIKHSIDCNPDVIHISLPISDLMIYTLLKKDRNWAKDQIERCSLLALEHGFEVSVGFQDASRADMEFMVEMINFLEQIGVKSVKLSDTVGVLTPLSTRVMVERIVKSTNICVGIHTHNDLGMAVANAITAGRFGVETVDVTLYGIGERAGNCDAFTFLEASEEIFESVPNRNALKAIQLKADSLIFEHGGLGKWIEL
jgi:homocitrate synthase NifV